MLRALLRPPHWLLVVAVLAWWLAYTVPTVMFSDTIADTLEVANATTQSGSSYNQLMVAGLAVIGMLALARWSPRAASREAVIALCLVLGYVVWALMTTFWSDDLGLSLRRLTLLLLLILGSAGLGAGFYGARPDGIDRLCRHLLVSAAVLVGMLGSVLLLRGGLTGFTDPDWSLKSTIKLSVFGYYLGYAAVAALCLSKPRRSIQLGAFGLCLLALLALKGRGVILSTVAASGIVLFRSVQNRIGRSVALITGILSTAAVLDLGTGGHAIGGIARTLASTVWIDYLTLGAGLDNVLDLSGRGPLWEVLLEHLWRNPLGYGFGAFWTPERLLVVQSQAGWPAVNSHNGLLDEILATGVVGVSLALAVWAYGVRISVTAARDPRLRDGALLVGGWLHLMFLFNMTDSTMQFFFQVPPILTLIAVSALLARTSAHAAEPSSAGAGTFQPTAPLGPLPVTHVRSHGYSS